MAEQDIAEQLILAIDDEDSCRFGIELMLRKSPYKVHTVSSAKGGLDYLLARVDTPDMPNIVLLDLMMPDMYGLDLLEILRAQTGLASTLIILQTGASNIDDIERAKQLGVDGYLMKPFDRVALLKAINDAKGSNPLKSQQ